jgi:hypothetical protein
MNKVFEYDEECKACRNNPTAKKPYAPMKRVRLINESESAIYELSQEQKVKPSCILCRAVRVLVKLPPEESLRLLEDKC